MSCWKIKGPQANCSLAPWNLEFAAASPTPGLRVARAGRDAVATVRFRNPQTGEVPPLDECYARGDDLLASYPQQPPADSGLHLQLASELAAEGLLVQLTVSVQTNLLDSHPTLDIELPGRELASRAAGGASSAARQRPAAAAPLDPSAVGPVNEILDGPLPLWTLLGPQDCATTRVHRTEERLVLRLFEEFLEKGVIRKARLWLLFSDTPPANWEGLYTRLCASPLPLTT